MTVKQKYMCDNIFQSRSCTWCWIWPLKTLIHDLKNIPKDVDDCEHSEDAGTFNQIQEAAKSGQLHSGDTVTCTGCQDSAWAERSGLWRAPSVSQKSSGAENTKSMNWNGTLRSPLHNHQALESKTWTEHGHSLGKGRRNIEEAEQDKEMGGLKRKWVIDKCKEAISGRGQWFCQSKDNSRSRGWRVLGRWDERRTRRRTRTSHREPRGCFIYAKTDGFPIFKKKGQGE